MMVQTKREGQKEGDGAAARTQQATSIIRSVPRVGRCVVADVVPVGAVGVTYKVGEGEESWRGGMDEWMNAKDGWV